MMVDLKPASDKPKRDNPVDKLMTKAQTVRRKFNAGRPRAIENKILSKLDAMGRTFQLFDKLRDAMREATLRAEDVMAGLIYVQPETPGKESARTIWLPTPDKVEGFVEQVAAIEKPIFLGVLFVQRDLDAPEAKRIVFFVFPFMAGPEAEKQLLFARNEAMKNRSKEIDLFLALDN